MRGVPKIYLSKQGRGGLGQFPDLRDRGQGGLSKKEGGSVFEGGVDTAMHTMGHKIHQPYSLIRNLDFQMQIFTKILCTTHCFK